MSGPLEEMEPVSGSSILNFNSNSNGSNDSNNICIKLESVPNYRSLGGLPIGTDGKYFIRPGVVSRSATPTNATFSDEFWLLEILNIKTLIDFRTSWENKTISPVRKFEDNFIQYSIKEREKEKDKDRDDLVKSGGSRKDRALEKEKEKEREKEKEKENGSAKHYIYSTANGDGVAIPTITVSSEKEMEEQRNGILWRIYNRNLTPEELTKLRTHSTGALRKRYSIPLINNRFFLEGVYSTAPNDTKMKSTVSRYILFNDSVGAFMLMNHLNDLGIVEMYKLTLIYTQEELLTIMRILKNRENYPILYFCSLGKDRTGMVTSILLSCLGVPRQIIIDDYSKSEGNLTAHLDHIRRYFTRVGLSKDEFIRSHKQTMEGLLNWVDETYGSVSNYLVTIGFTMEEQEELKRNLIVSKEEYDRLTEEAIHIPDLEKRKEEYINSQKQKKSPKLFSTSPRLIWRRLSSSGSKDHPTPPMSSANNSDTNNNNTLKPEKPVKLL